MTKIVCSICGKKHNETLANCCWINCACDSTICGQCGSTNLSQIEVNEDDDEAQYWCCQQCDDCGLEGCAMCI